MPPGGSPAGDHSVPRRGDLPVAVTKTISSWGVPETAAAACNPGFLYPGMPQNRESISHVLSPVRPSISQERLGFSFVCRPRGLCMMPSLEQNRCISPDLVTNAGSARTRNLGVVLYIQ